MKSKNLLLRILILSSLLLPACKREGCTDSAAENYDAKAKKNDNTCRYEGSAVIWYGEEYSASLALTGSTSLRFFVDEQLVGSSDANVYFTGAPDCGQNGSITVTRDLGGVKGKTYPYKVENQLGTIIESGIINFVGGDCVKVELSN